MKHAREDYNRIQDPAGHIPADEPVFLIRGQDKCGPKAVELYAMLAHDAGASPELVTAAYEQSQAMSLWQLEHGSKVPDMPTTEPIVDKQLEEVVFGLTENCEYADRVFRYGKRITAELRINDPAELRQYLAGYLDCLDDEDKH
jgi:hypothetical protein